jgi:hypothetical protein
MTDHRPPPPEPEDCLTHSRVSSCKGGTLIVEHVHDLATHLRMLADRDGYRPDECARCFGRVLHVHDYPERLPRGELDLPPVIRIVRFICADPACGATWRILPAILARHLWRIWPTVERTTHPAEPPVLDPMPIPERTARRWRERLASAAKQLVLFLASSGGLLFETIGQRAGLVATRWELVDVHVRVAAPPAGRRLADLAAVVHRLERGIRLM